METEREEFVTIEAGGRQHPPDWAVKQRYLIDLMNEAALDFVERYTRPDGTLIWREKWPGMDGSDDGYESFMTFPLFYILGGGEHVHALARSEWNAVTWQFTEYGLVHREFDAYYDWMHHGESSTYIYYFGLADPYDHMDRTRALRFAAMYTGEDPNAPNWDPELKMIRSPINGSKGPRSKMTAEDWVTHRPILANYLSPYEDVPGFDFSDDPLKKLDWTDDEVFAKILKLMNERMVPGDVPLNLNSTSLITSAYLYTGEERYKQWVLDYLDAWRERAERNDGILPDNIGPNAEIGELMDGKWWGGYYGWRWPHGAWTLLEATLIAGENSMLLTGDPSWLDLHRSQNDVLWDRRKDEDGVTLVPYRHSDSGWLDYRPMQARHYAHVYFMTRDPEDLARVKNRFPNREAWYSAPPRFGKSGHFWPERWFGYMLGENPDFPDQVLEHTYDCMQQRLDKIDNDDWKNLESWDVHHWQDLNPVVPEGLIQMAMGTPAAVYHGGLLQATVRYFDPVRERPGLPKDVAALVEAIEPDGFTLSLVNTNPLAGREVLVQAGSFGEHVFRTVSTADGEAIPVTVDDKVFRVTLGPWSQVRLYVKMDRFVNQPTYAFPWLA
ncbi:MAG: hypothetical protein ACP5JG_16350 [Anaerolineae bacterium]